MDYFFFSRPLNIMNRLLRNRSIRHLGDFLIDVRLDPDDIHEYKMLMGLYYG